MKNFLAAAIAITLVLGLAGCFWASDTGQGSVRLDLSGVAARGPGDRYARVWLVANDAVYPLGDGTDYVQKLIPGWEEVSITLEAIPVGPVYKVWVSIVDEQPEGWFRTYVWAESASFELFPGANAAVSFSPDTMYASQSDMFSPVTDYLGTPTLMGRNIVDVEVDINAGALFAAESGTLHEVSFNFTPYDESLVLNSLPAPAGETINSVSVALNEWGGEQVGIDTGRGVFPYNYEVFGSAITAKLGTVSVLDSSSAWYPAGNRVLFFRRASGWGGTYAEVESQPDSWIWANHDSGRVWDMTVSPNDGGAFFATSEGAFYVDGQYLYELSQGLNPSLSSYRQTIPAPHRILALDYWAYEGDELYLGTENGVWHAWTPAETSIIGTPDLVSGTEGFRFRKVAVDSGSYPALGAFLSDAYLFVFDGEVLHRYPLAAGLPGRITGMAWHEVFGASLRRFLVVSGDEGLVYKEF